MLFALTTPNYSQINFTKMSVSKGSSTMALHSEGTLELTQISSTETTSAGSGDSASNQSLPKSEDSTDSTNIWTLALQMSSSTNGWDRDQGWEQDGIANDVGTALSVVASHKPSSRKPKRQWAQSWEFVDFQKYLEHGGFQFVGSDNPEKNDLNPPTTDEHFQELEALLQDPNGKTDEFLNRMSSFASQVANFRESSSLSQTQSSSFDEAIGTPAATFKVTSNDQLHTRKRPRIDTINESDEQLGTRLKQRKSRFGRSVEQNASGLADAASTNVSLDEVIATRKIYPTPKFHRDLPSSLDQPPITDLRQRIQERRRARNQGQIPPIIIDGCNVARSYGEHVGGSKHLFSSRGILICVNYFVDLGCPEIYVVIPRAKLHDPTVQDDHILHDLNVEGRLWISWSRKLEDGSWVSSYDDRDILDLATRKDGVVISNDQYRDLWINLRWRYVIENRVFQFNFVADSPNEIRFPLDPLEWCHCTSSDRGTA